MIPAWLVLVPAVLLSTEVMAADPQYCILWSRAIAEVEVRTGSQLDLTFIGDDLGFIAHDDVDLKTADANLVEIRADGHRRTCTWLVEYDVLPLPDLPPAQTVNWANRIAMEAVGRQGTEPAAADPTPDGDAAWREACRSQYRTFNPDDGTVVRRGSPDRVKCPLTLENGEWVVVP